MDIKAIQQAAPSMPAQADKRLNADKSLDKESFGYWLEKSFTAVNEMQQEASHAATNLMSGKNKDIHGTMIAIQKADVAMNLMLEIRNKVISAYDEIKRMQF
ncbi:MAG: flagellar hook-basal body complex protein FliE [Desulfobacteraceae bacterium]|nr:flagellar hook-basal body complex protein FliE [Desulfobacteraceae bacterium]